MINYTWDDPSRKDDLTARGSDSFSWDYEDRMVSATVNSVTTNFTYRGDDLRDSRAVSGGATTTFTWDIAGGLPVVRDDGNQYLYGAGLTAQKQSGSWYYYLADGLGSTMAVVNASGVVQDSYTYDVYGTPTKTGSLANEFDFAGQQTDGTGLQYLRARYYDPATGTFLSRDLLEEGGGTGEAPFGYTSDRPTTLRDPSGLAPWGELAPYSKWCGARPWWWSRCAAGIADTLGAQATVYAFFGFDETWEADAFRHCVWSACLAISLGSKDAATFTNVHERADTASRSLPV